MPADRDDFEDVDATDYDDNEPYWDDDEAEDLSDEPHDGFLTDAEADADVLASAGMGTDEDYGYYGEHDDLADFGGEG